MSHSTTSGGGRRAPALALQRDDARRERSWARSVARMSVREPRGSGGEAPGRQRRRAAAPCACIAALAPRHLRVRHLLEIHLAAAPRASEKVMAASSSISVSSRRPGRRLAGGQRLGQAPVHLLGRRDLRQREARQQQPHHLFQQLRIAPEDVEGLVEQLALVAAVDEDGVQRPVEIVRGSRCRPRAPPRPRPAPCPARSAARRRARRGRNT